MTGVGYWGMTNDGHDPCYSIGFKNTGATPLYDYRGYTLAYIAKTTHLPHSITDEKLHALRSDLIGPSGSVEKKGKLKPTKEQQEGFTNGTHHVFLISASHYRDTFGRHFRFDCCYRSNFKTAPVNMWPVFVRERRVGFWERWRERRRRIANDGRRHR
ncbi:hypothetical protein DAH74_12865 [Sphingomonas koreensis]|uniref:Uncharacterized protein n=2 Tax=Sphingomonas koreensis TaxID=93064 RepID=A0AAJ4VCL0_9SPHN|nr:hypothetical protein DAH52_16430 [Sphingomonas koreensis]RSV06976.1 hypothetical protein CA257_02940 [Sphingomonas koreensis]RSW92998.1 hypothetical protein CA230_16390 [Sphingomonas koreensis]RSX24562.1 hypothetical protein DAH98_17275 [Sphingomonas koreensis]RSX43884.1 hypothetical protein DAH93_14015 [Sphingomonas koreensis]